MAWKKPKYGDVKLPWRREKKKKANTGHERGKAKGICGVTAKNERLHQKTRVAEQFQADLEAGVTTRRERDGSWWRYPK